MILTESVVSGGGGTMLSGNSINSYSQEERNEIIISTPKILNKSNVFILLFFYATKLIKKRLRKIEAFY
jgi:hypothetical protein